MATQKKKPTDTRAQRHMVYVFATDSTAAQRIYGSTYDAALQAACERLGIKLTSNGAGQIQNAKGEDVGSIAPRPSPTGKSNGRGKNSVRLELILQPNQSAALKAVTELTGEASATWMRQAGVEKMIATLGPAGRKKFSL